MRTLIRGVVYFTLVFSAGFLLGVARVLVLVPRVGERTAELLEAPVMVLVCYFSARRVVQHYPSTARRTHLLSGLIALAILLSFESLVALVVCGISILQYLESRDPISGVVYVASLGVFAILPWFVSGRAA